MNLVPSLLYLPRRITFWQRSLYYAGGWQLHASESWSQSDWALHRGCLQGCLMDGVSCQGMGRWKLVIVLMLYEGCLSFYDQLDDGP